MSDTTTKVHSEDGRDWLRREWDNRMSEPKLLPCPYCGNTPDSSESTMDAGHWGTGCISVCPVNPMAWSYSREESEKAWNTRPLETEMYEALKAARLHLSDYSLRTMWGTDGDDDVRRAQEAIVAALAKATGVK